MIRPGWVTFPLWPIASDGSCACGDSTCEDAGKHPSVRWGKASLGPGQSIDIPPGYGIGLATGERSGVVGLDLDRKNGLDGLGALGALAERHGGTAADLDTLTSLTPSGGYHLLYEHPGFQVRNSASVLGPGIDVRGDGGYLVLPPSPHRKGGCYAFLNPDAAIRPVPEWLRALLMKPPKAPRRVTRDTLEKIAARWSKSKSVATQDLGKALASVAKEEAFADEGERDQTLFKLCRDLARELPDADPGSLAGLFEGSLDRMPGGPTSDAVVEKFTRAQAELGGAGRVEVWVTDNIPKMGDAGESALARAGDVYRRGTALARVSGDGRIVLLGKAAVREKLSKGARWMTGENASTVPPDWIVEAVRDRQEWPSLRAIEGVVEVPVLRADGSVLDTPGYDASTALLYHPRVAYPKIADRPTRADAEAALRELVDPVEEFAWESPEHMVGWVAAVLTPLARDAYAGPAPLFLFDASTAGSGKSMLARLASIIATGAIGATAPWPTEEEERRKAITTYAREGVRVMTWDNVTGRLGGRSLCQALTEYVWTDRVLGKSESWRGPMRVTFYATANNVELREDMDRRTVHVRLDPGVERPELRTGWRYPDVVAWVQANQPRLTAAALTILRAYSAAGNPDGGFQPWGSYEEWSRRVIGPLVWIGLPDPGGAREALRDADPEAEYIRAIVSGWESMAGRDGVTVREALDKMYPPGRPWDRPLNDLSSGVDALLRLGEGERPSAHALGLLLRRLRGRVVGGRTLRSESARAGVVRWRVA